MAAIELRAFVREGPAEWLIHSIEDDFRAKITKRLQIPNSFPLDPPDLQLDLSELRSKSPGLYKQLGIPIAAE